MAIRPKFIFHRVTLCKDPELKRTAGGKNFVSVSCAYNNEFKDKQGVMQKRTDFFRLLFWDRNAEVLAKYCRKGMHLSAEGLIKTGSYADDSGKKISTVEFVVDNFIMLHSKPKDERGRPEQSASPAPTGEDPDFDEMFQDTAGDDIPF